MNVSKEYFMREAIKEAIKAKSKLEVPIGAVIVKNNKIISRGYNLRETKKNSLCHAEIIAINKACKKLNNFRLNECEMYVTVEPCPMCAGAIVQSRIKRVVFGAFDKNYGAICSNGNILEIKANHKVEYEYGIMQKECSYIVKEFFKGIRK